MASFYLCPLSAFMQIFTDVGIVLPGALVWTYAAGTSTPVATYTDSTGGTPNSNPIQLNSAGRLSNVNIWQASGVAIKVVFSTNAGTPSVPVFGVQIGPTFDNIQGINDISITNATLGNPASGSGADLVANAMRSYDLFATARAANVPVLKSGQTLIVDFEGGTTVADGLGGLFYWNASSTAADDGLTVIKPTGLATGRYLRTNPYGVQLANKAGVTSRATNTSPSADPDLTLSLPTAGTYIIEAWINDITGTSAGGLQGEIAFTGSINNGTWAMNGNGSGVTPVGLTSINSAAEFQSAQSATGSMKIDGILQATTSGTLSFKWAQNSSSGTASVVGTGSWLRVTRISSATGAFTPQTLTYNTPGTAMQTIPVGATTMEIEVWGGSGAGGGALGTAGTGGGSGGYSKSLYNVAAAGGQTVAYTVGATGTLGNSGGASSASTGTFAITTMTGNGGVYGGSGGAGGTASGGTSTNTTGNAGSAGNPGSGGTGLVGDNGTGATGGVSGSTVPSAPTAGGAGLVAFKFT